LLLYQALFVPTNHSIFLALWQFKLLQHILNNHINIWNIGEASLFEFHLLKSLVSWVNHFHQFRAVIVLLSEWDVSSLLWQELDVFMLYTSHKGFCKLLWYFSFNNRCILRVLSVVCTFCSLYATIISQNIANIDDLMAILKFSQLALTCCCA